MSWEYLQDSNISLLSIYSLNEFVAIDVETTGLDSVKDKIIDQKDIVGISQNLGLLNFIFFLNKI